MKIFIRFVSCIGLLSISQLAYSADITDTYTTGDTLTSTTLNNIKSAVNSKQDRVSGVCAPGSAIGSVNSDGSVNCESDSDTTYSAGAGISISGQIISTVDDFVQVIAALDTNTTAANTWEDVAGMTISLTPGTWDIGYDVDLATYRMGGTNTKVWGSVAIFDSLNNQISATQSTVRSGPQNNSSDYQQFSMSRNTRITVVSSTDYKLRLRSINDPSQGVASVRASNEESVFWARRIQ